MNTNMYSEHLQALTFPMQPVMSVAYVQFPIHTKLLVHLLFFCICPVAIK